MVTRISMLRFGREIRPEEFARALRTIEEDHHPLLALALNAKPESDETWITLSWANPGFDELLSISAAFEPASFSPDQVAAAKTLKDINLWKLATSVKASGGVPLKSLQQQLGSTEQGLRLLQTAGLVQKEHVVICKRTSGLVNRLPSRELLERLDEQGVRCGSCGRLLTDERLDELIAPTDLGKQLLDHGRWMAAVLIEELDRLGIPREKVLLEFRESSEEVDAFVDIDGSLVMIELKDKEFSMGHAYPLSGRIAMYHPKYVLIVSRDKVAPDVRSYFERTKPEARLSYVEELTALPQELEILANLARSSKVETLLEYFNPLTLGVDIPRLVASKLGITLPKKEQMLSLGAPIHTDFTNFFVANS